METELYITKRTMLFISSPVVITTNENGQIQDQSPAHAIIKQKEALA